MKSILDKDFTYTPAIKTDVRETFEKAKKAIEEERKRAEDIIAEAERIVAKTRIRAKVA